MESSGTTYIVIHQSDISETWISGIICLLLGGFQFKTRFLSFVIIGADNTVSDRHIDDYQITKNLLAEVCIPMMSQELTSPIMVPFVSEGQCQFMSEDDSVIECKRIYDSINSSDFVKRIKKGEDKIIVVSITSDSISLLLYTILKSVLANNSISVDIKHVCEFAYEKSKDVRQVQSYILKHFINAKNTIITGIREDAYREGFTLIQTIAAICDDTNYGMPEIAHSTSKANYTIGDVGSCEIQNALRRLGWFLQLLDSKSLCGVLNYKCRDAYLKALSNANEYSSAIETIDGIYGMFWSNIPADHFSKDIEDEHSQNLTKRIDKLKLNLNGKTEAQKSRIVINSLTEALDDVAIESSSSIAHYKPCEILYELPNHAVSLLRSQPSFIPLQITESNNMAFHFHLYNSEDARMWRSYCLDLWELFFVCHKEATEEKIFVEEYNTHEIVERDVLEMFHTYANRSEKYDTYAYKVQMVAEKSAIAYSSPLTGFAIVKMPVPEIEICGRRFFGQGNPRELSERDTKFQSFLYKYIELHKSFSPVFKDYVEKEICIDLKTNTKSLGRNILNISKNFGKHVGIEIVEFEKE